MNTPLSSARLIRWARHPWVGPMLAGAGALCLAGLAAWSAQGYLATELAHQKAQLAPVSAQVELIVAKRDLVAGDVLDESSLAIRKVPKEFALAGAFSPSALDQIRGQRLHSAAPAGEPVMPHQIAARVSALSQRLRPGIRAVTILVDEVNSLSGMLQPGDRIDLQASVRPPAFPGQPAAAEITGFLLQNVPVLATGKQARPIADDPQQQRPFTAITVEVEPLAAQKLIVAQRAGKLTALLRHRDDHQAIHQAPLDLFGLLALKTPSPVARIEPATEIIVGGKGALPVAATSPTGPATASASAPVPAPAIPSPGTSADAAGVIR